MKQLEIDSSDTDITITKDTEGFHFMDNKDGAEIWIKNESIKKLVIFLIDNLVIKND